MGSTGDVGDRDAREGLVVGELSGIPLGVGLEEEKDAYLPNQPNLSLQCSQNQSF